MLDSGEGNNHFQCVFSACVTTVFIFTLHPRTFDDNDIDIPALAVLQQLLDSGWSLADCEPAAHTASSPRSLQKATATLSRKHCWRCLLQLDRLLGSGLTGLDSGQRWEYYYLLLRATDPLSVPLGKSAKQYAALISGKKADSDHDIDTDSDSDSPIYDVPMQVADNAQRAPKRRRATAAGSAEDIGSLFDAPAAAVVSSPSSDSDSATSSAAGTLQPEPAQGEAPWVAPPPPPTEPGVKFNVGQHVFTVSRWPLVATEGGPPPVHPLHCALPAGVQ